MAYSLNIPVVSVSSLEALAYNVKNGNNKTICSLIDARNNQVYCGIFNSDYELQENYIADDINNIVSILKKYEDIAYVGDGSIVHKDLLKIRNNLFDNEIHAKNVAMCGYCKYKKGKVESSDTILPMYLRKSQAERMKQKNE